MKNFLAQDFRLGPGPVRGRGTIGLETGDPTQAGTIFNNFLSSVIGLMTIIAAIWFVFTFITGAIGIITSSEDKAALETARKKITTGIIGLVVVIAAVFIINLIGTLLGFNLILDPARAFNTITQ